MREIIFVTRVSVRNNAEACVSRIMRKTWEVCILLCSCALLLLEALITIFNVTSSLKQNWENLVVETYIVAN